MEELKKATDEEMSLLRAKIADLERFLEETESRIKRRVTDYLEKAKPYEVKNR